MKKEQNGGMIMPVLGIESAFDNWNGGASVKLFAAGFLSKSEQNDNGYQPGASYLSIKMGSSFPNVSAEADTYWVPRGAVLLSDDLRNMWGGISNTGVFMETEFQDIQSRKIKFNIVESDPENSGIPGCTSHYLRMSGGGFCPSYHTLRYVRFYFGDPERQGEYVCLCEYDFLP